jgi:anti-anti-sigma regulatory factor
LAFSLILKEGSSDLGCSLLLTNTDVDLESLYQNLMNTVHTLSHFAPGLELGNGQPLAMATVVLQPHGSLNSLANPTFANSLNQALDQANEVIVDLLWVDEVDATGIDLFVTSMAKAKSQGKLLSFLGMDGATRARLDGVLDQQHDLTSTVQSECFMPDFEQFLETYKAEQALMRSPTT